MIDTANPHALDTPGRPAGPALTPNVCDPDFDDGSEELERHLADIRLTLDHA